MVFLWKFLIDQFCAFVLERSATSQLTLIRFTSSFWVISIELILNWRLLLIYKLLLADKWQRGCNVVVKMSTAILEVDCANFQQVRVFSLKKFNKLPPACRSGSVRPTLVNLSFYLFFIILLIMQIYEAIAAISWQFLFSSFKNVLTKNFCSRILVLIQFCHEK